MLRTVAAVLASMTLTTAVVTNAWMQKKQFYPTVVHLTRSSQSMLILYVQAFVLIFLFAKVLGKVFFGALRQAEMENLMERTWYAIIDTCLAFTMFRDDLSPGFVAAFTIFFVLKGFHWLCEDRVDFMERSPVITLLFKFRITILLSLLAMCDVCAIFYAYERTMAKGASVQMVFGFEYAILFTVTITAFVKFILHSIDLQSEDPWENKSMYMLYLDLVMNLMRLILYLIFIGTMFKIHTLPIFALRPMYLAIRKFRKSLSDIVLSRRAIAQMEVYPNATEEDVANDNTCIICREEMVPGPSAKKLPCGHIFHAACLRSWFQRQQTCPTCRLDVLGAHQRAQGGQGAAARNQRGAAANRNQQLADQLRAQFGGNLPAPLRNVLQNAQQQQQPQPAAGVQVNAANVTDATDLVNMLQVPTLMASLTANPLPPPPPMPPINLADLTEDELHLLESNERAGLEARIRHLQEIRTLMDAAAFKMDQFMSATVPPATTTPTEVTTPQPDEEQTPVVEEVHVDQDVTPTEAETPPAQTINPFEELSTEQTPSNTVEPEKEVETKKEETKEDEEEKEEELTPNEIRRRRLAAIQTSNYVDDLDLD